MRHSIPKPIALVLNYPANPTAYTATLDLYAEVVRYCRDNEIFILSDLAYSEIYFDDNPPPSVLQVPGAMDIAVEFTSMSKTYSMPGWRVGFAVGNERLIAALSRVKSYLDYGAFTPIQVAAAAALNGSDDVVEEVRSIYRNRRDVMVESFGRAGWDLPVPAATMFVWAPIPRSVRRSRFARIRQASDQGDRRRRRSGRRLRRIWRSTMSASRWWRTSSASARPPAPSRNSWPVMSAPMLWR